MVHEVDEELREIKREIIESRGLVIKTNNLTNALSADIRSIAKRQQGYERRITWSSATSYVVFVLVVFAALKLAMDARIDQLKGESEQRVKDLAHLKDELNRSNERETARQTADERAAKFYELVRQGKRTDLIAQWEQMKGQPLSKAEAAMFGDAVERAKNELAGAALPAGHGQGARPALAGGGVGVRGVDQVPRGRGDRAERAARARRVVSPPESPEGGDPDPHAARGERRRQGSPRRRALPARVVPDGHPGVERREEHVAHADPPLPRVEVHGRSKAAAGPAPADALTFGTPARASGYEDRLRGEQRGGDRKGAREDLGDARRATGGGDPREERGHAADVSDRQRPPEEPRVLAPDDERRVGLREEQRLRDAHERVETSRGRAGRDGGEAGAHLPSFERRRAHSAAPAPAAPACSRTRGHSGSGPMLPFAYSETTLQPPLHTARSVHDAHGSAGAAE